MSVAFCVQPPAVEWMKTFVGEGCADGYCARQTYDGGFVVAGATSIPNHASSSLYIVRLRDTGDSTWSAVIGDTEELSESRFIRQTYDGGYILLGDGQSGPGAPNYIYLVKFDSSGGLEWKQQFLRSSSYIDEGRTVEQTTDSGFIIGGLIAMDTAGAWVVKVDKQGSFEWDRSFPAFYDGNPDVPPVTQTSDGGYALCARFHGQGFLLVKLDESGALVWQRTYPEQSISDGYSVVQTTDGGFAVTGPTMPKSYPDDADMYLLKTDSIGDVNWKRTFGGGRNDVGYCVEQTDDGELECGG
jgi:hypothetical protein